MDLKGKNILVVGLGASGLAAARLCLSRGASVVANDLATECPAAAKLAQMGARVVLGGHNRDDFTSCDLLVLSPGVDQNMPAVAAARRAGASVIGELELGYRFLSAPAAMITGTNGKSTVTSLVGRMLAASGEKVFVGGNLGAPLCDYVAGEQDAAWAVLEVSSFQLDTADTLNPKVGALLNLSPDHMDRYPDFEAYALSKFSLFGRQQPGEAAILFADDMEVAQRAHLCPQPPWGYGQCGPRYPGAWLEDGGIALARERGQVIKLSTRASKLPGLINRLNLAAASLISLACGAGPEAMQKVIDEFPGLSHRIQFAGSLAGVDYFDDSKGTNPGAVIAAIKTLARPLILLLGGRDKGISFKPLRAVMNQDLLKVLCFGEAAQKIHDQIQNFAPSQVAGSLEDAFLEAKRLAKPGQAVLLSPGCTSFDAYDSYAQRGKHFQALVKEAAHG